MDILKKKIEEIRFLLFRGSWENEGVFCALETEKDIIILSAGKDYFGCEISKQQIQLGKKYLEERKEKIRGIVISNTNYRNISFLNTLYSELECQELKIYTSFEGKLILQNKFPKLKNKIIPVECKNKYQLGDFYISFINLSTNVIGNLGTHFCYKNHSFFLLEDFRFSTIVENELFNKENFQSNLNFFLDQKKENSYLITSCQDIHWHNDNSLFFIKNNLPIPDINDLFFIFYDFDFLHIIEMLEIVYRHWKKKVILLNKEFFFLLQRILINTPHLRQIISLKQEKEKKTIYLFVTNPQQSFVETLDYNLRALEIEKKETKDMHFIVGIPPTIRGEEKLARFLDYLYSKSNKVTNYSKAKITQFLLGTSFFDLQAIIKILNPKKILLLNNSYKNKEMINFLPKKNLFFLDNNHYWDINEKTPTPFSSIHSNKNIISLEEILIEQRKKIKNCGLLIIILIISLEKKIELKKIHLEKIAISFEKEEEKIKEKIKKWWENKIVDNLNSNLSIKTIRNQIEKRISGLLKKTISFQHNKDPNWIPEIVVLTFKDNKKEEE